MNSSCIIFPNVHSYSYLAFNSSYVKAHTYDIFENYFPNIKYSKRFLGGLFGIKVKEVAKFNNAKYIDYKVQLNSTKLYSDVKSFLTNNTRLYNTISSYTKLYNNDGTEQYTQHIKYYRYT